MEDIVILGAGGFAKEVEWLIEETNTDKVTWNLLGFIDTDPKRIGKVINRYIVFDDKTILKKYRGIYAVGAVGDFVTISPGARISGWVSIETGCYIGINAAIIERKTIHEWSIIGAGAVVVDDIPQRCVAGRCSRQTDKNHRLIGGVSIYAKYNFG